MSFEVLMASFLLMSRAWTCEVEGWAAGLVSCGVLSLALEDVLDKDVLDFVGDAALLLAAGLADFFLLRNAPVLELLVACALLRLFVMWIYDSC